MSRTRVLVSVAVFAAFGAGIATGWLLATRQSPDRLANPNAPDHAVVPPPNGPAGQPHRAPELFGRIEAVQHSGPNGTAVLVRSAKPNLAGWDSEQNAFHRSIDMPCWVGVRGGSPVPRRGGDTVDVAVGQTVSAWCSGPMATTNPPWWGGDFVVVEPEDR